MTVNSDCHVKGGIRRLNYFVFDVGFMELVLERDVKNFPHYIEESHSNFIMVHVHSNFTVKKTLQVKINS